jgi:hypothetical protein
MDAKGNKVWALQNGGAMGHNKYSEAIAEKIGDVVTRYKNGGISKKQAIKEIEKIRNDAIKSLKKDPEQLARTKEHLSKDKSKSHDDANKSTGMVGGSDKDGRGPRY